ncbi:hydrogenase 4 subunit B [candidate division KSB1 bacterium]|nr:hydrogenase 4 subunit B [candidate division KSB1 bacterium]
MLLLISAYGFGALVALISGRGALGRGLVALGAVMGATAGIALGASVLISNTPFEWSLPALLPLAGGFALRLDALGAFFLILIGAGAIPAAIYGAGYSAIYEDGRASLRLLGVMFNLFVLAMSLVTMANNILTFLLMWEAMSLTSYFLVITEGREASAVRAGLWYAAMTHAGLLMLLAAFLLLANGGSGAFGDLRASAAALSPAIRNLIFVLAFLGFGSKAGLVPLHIWLPRAHPAAPSHVSALMSGVMIKIGVYGLLRVALDLLGGGPTWWGVILLLAGAVSAVVGILYALMENDLKRLLAYSSVENIGIIFIGVGAGFVFGARGLAAASALAFIAALYHALNHAAFKGLLFMGAGAVLHATHTRDMNRMGGLIKPLPWTALFFLVGSVAIAGLPPLNGFVSEWLLFQSLLPGVNLPQPVVAALMMIAVGMLALTSGLAAAGFVKAFGITFLAIPRSTEAAHAHEGPVAMRLSMALSTLLCLGLGVLPFLVMPVLGRVIAGLDGLPAEAPTLALGLALQTPNDFAQISPTLAALALLVVLGLTAFVLGMSRFNRRVRVSASWGCGRIGQTPRMEYTATAFAEPLRRVFAELYRPTKELTIDFHPESKYFVQAIDYKTEIRSWFEEFIYHPLVNVISWVSKQVRRVQSGSLHGYLVYLFIVLMFMLCALLLPWK